MFPLYLDMYAGNVYSDSSPPTDLSIYWHEILIYKAKFVSGIGKFQR